VSEFGEALRELRKRHGFVRQQDLAQSLGGEVARSTIANLEAGRQRPTPRVWALLAAALPAEAVTVLKPLYEQARAEQAASAAERRPAKRARGGPVVEPPPDYVFERYDVMYVLRESRSPEEIIEIRHVRALTKGAHDFGLSFSRDSAGFEVETEVLFGGEIVGLDVQELPGKTMIMQLLDFKLALRKGERHSFGVRYWVQRDPGEQGQGHVVVQSDYQMEAVGVHVNFWGVEKPKLCWAYQGLPDPAMAPGQPEVDQLLQANRHSMVRTNLRKPATGTCFGVAWQW
jgi:transcriptional regulator with XRE-family HTH domain